MVDWNEMVVLVKVVEEGSFVGAARALGLPKSTVSRKIARLEDRLGARLLHRTTRVVRTTPAGQAYYDRCAALVRDAHDAERMVTSRQERPSGRLRISTSVLLGQHYLAPVVASFLETYPDVQVDLDLSNRYVDLVEDGFDLAVRAGVMPDADLVARRLGPAYLLAVASPDYLDRRGQPQVPADLSDHDCIIVGGDGAQATWVADGIRVVVTGRLAVNDMEVARDAAIAGLGIARVPTFVVGDALRQGLLVRALPRVLDRKGGVYAVYPSRRHLSTAVRAFVDFVVDAFLDHPPWADELV